MKAAGLYRPVEAGGGRWRWLAGAFGQPRAMRELMMAVGVDRQALPRVRAQKHVKALRPTRPTITKMALPSGSANLAVQGIMPQLKSDFSAKLDEGPCLSL